MSQDETIKETVIARLSTMPSDQKISVGSEGEFTKEELIDHIKRGDKIGKKFIEIELEFLRALKEVALSLIKGNCTEESYIKSQNMFRKNIQKLLTSEAPPGSENWVRYLFWDMKHQTILGDKNACFE